jgi:hypothetical protein
LYGEATAALLAATFCSSMGLSHVTFEGDSLTVNLAINNPTISQDWRISSIISDFILTISPTTSWSASNINRSANFCAHYVADWVATIFTSSCIPTSSSSIPPCLGMDFSFSFFKVP